MRVRIDYDYLRQVVRLCWQDVRYGLQHGYIAADVASRFCDDELAAGRSLSSELETIFSSTDEVEIAACVGILADSEPPVPSSDLKRKWLYVVLSWLYEHRSDSADPFEMVEAVYADFDYPKEISSFVRYMPMQGPDLGSREKNEMRMMTRWQEYLKGEKQVFAPLPQ